MNKQVVWTTELVNQAIERISDGYILKRAENPFFDNIIGLRRSGLTFQMTESELEEYAKCYGSIRYFAEDYFYVKGEEGSPIKIKLRDYQDNMLDNLIKYNFNIWMCSRQTGKTIC